ncbi:unnamed protein product [Musa textilis]
MGAAGSGGPLLAPGALESVLHLLEGAHALVSRGRRGRLHFREVCSGGWRRELEVEFVVSPRRRIGVALQEVRSITVSLMLWRSKKWHKDMSRFICVCGFKYIALTYLYESDMTSLAFVIAQ